MALDRETQALIRKYDQPAPRYTSYPTAPHFKAGLDGADRARLLAPLGDADRVSLYLHLPFCDTLCHYCGCFTKVVNSYDPVESYLCHVRQEIRLVGEALSGRPLVSMLHFGGGTPNVLKADDLKSLIDLLRNYFEFNEDSEIALELDPRILDEEMIQAMAKAGVKRVSLGVQDFDPQVQHAINRVQPFEMVASHVQSLRAHGIERINFDLIYGLPLQTLAGIKENIAKTITLSPDRIALFGYAHVPWMRPHQKLLEKFDRPNADMRFEMFDSASRALCAGGYRAIGIDHFARADDDMTKALECRNLHRNFQGYTVDDAETLVGFGLSSISSFSDTYLQNPVVPAEYRKAIDQGVLPVARSCLLDRQDIFRRAVIEQLMCYFKVDLQAILSEHGFQWDSLDDALERLSPLIEDGLAVLGGGTLAVTDKGRPFARVVCAAFDQYLDTGQMRHARAV